MLKASAEAIVEALPEALELLKASLDGSNNKKTNRVDRVLRLLKASLDG